MRHVLPNSTLLSSEHIPIIERQPAQHSRQQYGWFAGHTQAGPRLSGALAQRTCAACSTVQIEAVSATINVQDLQPHENDRSKQQNWKVGI